MNRVLEKIAKDLNYNDYIADIKVVSSAGSNITSILNLVTLRAPGKPELKLFAKVASMKENMRATYPFCPFSGELYFYSNIQKQFAIIEEKHNVPVEHRVRMPKMYGSSDEYLNEIVVLDDLVALGFEDFDRQNFADLEYVLSAIELVAKFHALSMAYREEEPYSFAQAREFLTITESKIETSMALVKSKVLANALEVANNDEYKTKLQNYFFEDKANGFQHCTNIYCSRKRNILLHGDYKPSNLMHRRRNGKLEMVPVDFQMVRNGDPVVDLMYFIFTATDEEFRRKHYHVVLDEYYVQLRAALRRLHLDPDQAYSEKMYRADLEENKMMGLVIAVVLLPLVLAEEKEVGRTFDSEEANISDLAVQPSALFRERFNGILNNYVEWGLL